MKDLYSELKIFVLALLCFQLFYKRKLLLSVFLSCFMSINSAVAGIAVIVHPSVKTESLSIAQVVNLFLGKSKLLPSGKLVIPIDQTKTSEVRQE